MRKFSLFYCKAYSAKLPATIFRLSFCLSALLFLHLFNKVLAQQNVYKADKHFVKQVPKLFKAADAQSEVLRNLLPSNSFPKTFQNNKLETSDAGWWCSGFYPGVLIKLYQQTGNEQLLTEAKRILKNLESQQYNKNTHDLGFMMYCSFGNLQEIKPSKECEKILINSAKSLASRFDPTVGCIKSWNSDKTDYIVIIDNMMNLELLFWATKATGDSSFYKIAVKHANTTMANHFRANYSSYHVINYNAETGKPQKKVTAQGYSDNSAWARGQAWGLYGYTVMYRETHDRKYLLQAKNIASFILSNPRLPADKIPYWDYDAPDIPDAKRDASTAAIMASAFLELCRYSSGTPAGLTYFNTAQTILKNLSKPAYTASAGSNGGFILKHSVGNMNNKTEVDAPLTYADYYYIEALERYKKFK